MRLSSHFGLFSDIVGHCTLIEFCAFFIILAYVLFCKMVILLSEHVFERSVLYWTCMESFSSVVQ